MAETVRRSGVRIDIKQPSQISHLADKPLPPQIFLGHLETKHLSAKQVPRREQGTIAPPPMDEISISALPNQISIAGYERYAGNPLKRLFWKHADLSPHGHLHLVSQVNEIVWQMYFGENPLEGTTETFGKERALIEIEFLGHPDEVLHDVIALQEESYRPELLVKFPEPDNVVGQNTWRRTILKTSPVLHATVAYEAYDRKNIATVPFEYPARVMFYLELTGRDHVKEDKYDTTQRRIASQLRVGVATLADADNKLRVYKSSPLYLEESKKKKGEKKTDKKEDAPETPVSDQKLAAVTQSLIGMFRLATQVYETQAIDLRQIEYWQPNEVLTEEVLASFETDIHQLRKRLTTTKKVTKK